MSQEPRMRNIQILHDRERFREMLSYAVSRENLWGNIDVITRDGAPGLLLVVLDQLDMPNRVSSGVVHECYGDALADLGDILDDLNPDFRPLSHF
jgi:hypothetical protein